MKNKKIKIKNKRKKKRRAVVFPKYRKAYLDFFICYP